MGLSRRATIALATGTAALVTLAGVWLVFGTGGPSTSDDAASGPLSLASSLPAIPSTVTTDLTTTTAPTTTIAPTSAPTTTTTRATVATRHQQAPVAAMPAPVRPPANIAVPPPPHTTPAPGCTATHTGVAADQADVRSALLTAAGRQYWSGVSNPPLVAEGGDTGSDDSGAATPSDPVLGPPAAITVPPTLMEAIAWQESGWQSNITSCDGGNGTMQIQSATAQWMNQRFGTSYDDATLSGNAALGGEYIEWLISYFGENSFGHHYDMTDPDLVAAVLDAYNAGPASVGFTGGHTVLSHYAATVEALMSQQPWG